MDVQTDRLLDCILSSSYDTSTYTSKYASKYTYQPISSKLLILLSHNHSSTCSSKHWISVDGILWVQLVQSNVLTWGKIVPISLDSALHSMLPYSVREQLASSIYWAPRDIRQIACSGYNLVDSVCHVMYTILNVAVDVVCIASGIWHLAFDI